MKLDSIPNADPAFDEDLDVKLMLILQRTFMLGVMVGQNQVADDMQAMSMPLNQAVQGLMQELNKLVPGVTAAANIAGSMPKDEEMSKSLKSSKRYSVLSPNYKKLEDQHQATLDSVLDHLEKNKKETAAKITKEIKRYKPKK